MDNKEVKISFWASHLTTIITVTLVLLLIGIIAEVWIATTGETERIKQRFELTAVMTDSVTDSTANILAKQIEQEPFASNVRVISKDQALENWKKETGEDLLTLYGVNPLSPEISFCIKGEYASPNQIASITREVSALPGVESVSSPDASLIDNMTKNLSGLTLILGLVAAVMLVISFILINNTVQLTVYSRRFSIYTMQLVGATKWFVSRPFVRNNLLCGILAGIFASLLLSGFYFLAPMIGIPSLEEYISWTQFGMIASGLIAIGLIICAIAAQLATWRYLRKDYNKLFK